MTTAHSSALWILVVALVSAALSSPTTVPPPIQLQSSPTPSPNTSAVDCAVDYYTCRTSKSFKHHVCRCDEQLCTQFGDCCAESNYTHNTTGPEFSCVSTTVLDEGREAVAYWMIASCPKRLPVSGPIKRLAELCEARSLSSPPISDTRTGLVYRNKYCAQCHGVPEKEQISWRSEWRCSNAFQERNVTIDIALLLDSCTLLLYAQPKSVYRLPLLPRACDAAVVYTCQPPPGTDTSTAEYRELSNLCRSELVDIRITESSNTILYKNEFCALCSTFGQSLTILCPLETGSFGGNTPEIHIPQNTFSLFLDITGSGKVVIASESILVTTTIQESCGEGQVFDVYNYVCREALCQPGRTYNGTFCLPVDYNCTLIALNASEYQSIDSLVIFWIALEQNVSVQGYTSEGKPLVCINFTSNFTTMVNETITRTLYGYPPAYTILSYLGLSVDVVAAAILLFTYTVFAEMRTFYGKLFMNFVLVLLLGDLTFLLGSAVYAVSLNDVVCQVVAILLHYLFLARFVWMSLLSLNVARHFYHAMKMVASKERESWHYLILYMAAGWLSPLLVLIVTVPVNYAIPGAVGYGVEGLCWMNQTLAVTASFIVPLAICILFTTGVFVFVCSILVKVFRSDMRNDLQHKTGFQNCRILVAVFSITGVMWLFGFLALIDSALSWAWYLFIILNTTQAVFLTLAYVCTAKVLRLYRSALARSYKREGRKHRTTLNTRIYQADVELKGHGVLSSNGTVSTTGIGDGTYTAEGLKPPQ